MPLARILARFKENADVLAEELRARGFEVQTPLPEEKSPEPADLEIVLEDCAIEDALAGVAGSPLSQDVWVFIAPGAVSENSRPFGVADLISESVATKPLLKTPAERPLRWFLPEPSESQGLDPTATAIGDLGGGCELVENVSAMMTFQSEPDTTQEPESNLIPIDANVISAANDRETQLEPLGEPQDVPFQPEAVITGDEPFSCSPAEERVAANEEVPEQAQAVAYDTEVVADALAGVELRLEQVPMEPPVTNSRPDHKFLPAYRVRVPRWSRGDKLFWKIAPLASMLTLTFLLLAVLSHRFSPVPAGLAPDSGDHRQSIPFANVKSGTTNAVPSRSVVTAPSPAPPAAKPSAAKLQALSPVAPNTLAPNTNQDGTANSGVSLATSSERVVAPTTRPRSLASSDADYVAKDSIVRYGASSARPVPRRQHSPSSEGDYVAKDTVVRHPSTSSAAEPRK